jgi:hypothetical protein
MRQGMAGLGEMVLFCWGCDGVWDSNKFLLQLEHR